MGENYPECVWICVSWFQISHLPPGNEETSRGRVLFSSLQISPQVNDFTEVKNAKCNKSLLNIVNKFVLGTAEKRLTTKPILP